MFGPEKVFFRVSNGITKQDVAVSYGSTWPGGHVQGETYVVVPIDVLPEFGFIGWQMGFNTEWNIVNGLQLVPIPAPSTALPMLASLLLLSRCRR